MEEQNKSGFNVRTEPSVENEHERYWPGYEEKHKTVANETTPPEVEQVPINTENVEARQKVINTLEKPSKKQTKINKTIFTLCIVIAVLVYSIAFLSHKVYVLDMHKRVYQQEITHLVNRMILFPAAADNQLVYHYVTKLKPEDGLNIFNYGLGAQYYKYITYLMSALEEETDNSDQAVEKLATIEERMKILGGKQLSKYPNSRIHCLRYKSELEEEFEN